MNSTTQHLVSIESLAETAVKIRPELLMFPIFYTKAIFEAMGAEMIPGIQNKLTQYDMLRRGGLMRPYYPGIETDRRAIAELEENTLQVYLAAGIHEDNIQNYVTNTIGNMSLLGTNKTYKNPAERLILMTLMTVFAEDFVDISWHGKRNEKGKNKYDMIDGWYTLLKKYQDEGRISVANRNLIETGNIEPKDPTNPEDIEVWLKIDAFLRQVHPSLTSTGAVLNMPRGLFAELQAAISNKFKYQATADQYGHYRLPGAWDNIRVFPNLAMGEGSRLLLTKPGNLQVGFDTLSDDEFVLVRHIKDDANLVTYNIQERIGENIRALNPKVLATNDGDLLPIEWAGDILNQEYTVGAGAGTGGTADFAPKKESYNKGDEVTFTATPGTGYAFESWSNGVTTNPFKQKVMGNTQLYANFKKQ